MKGKAKALLGVVSMLIILSLALPAGCSDGGGGGGMESLANYTEGGKRVVLKRFEGYPDDGDRWLSFVSPAPHNVPAHTGAWVDEVVITVEPDPWQAVSRLGTGDIDVYTYQSGYVDPAPFAGIADDPEIDYTLAYGSYRELRFNTYMDPDTKEPLFSDGRLNPFAVPEIREAMNWLVDREHIVDTYLYGMGAPRWTVLGTQFPDHALYYDDIIAGIEGTYGYNFTAAKAVFDVQMPLLGAVWDEGEGLWYHNGTPVEIICLIRDALPPFPGAGHYVADQVEALGFQVTRLVKSALEARLIWIEGDPADGLFHIYTGGWSSQSVPRDQGAIFNQMYTHRVMTGWRLWAILEEQLEEFPELDQAAMMLWNYNFSTMQEREALFETALTEAMRFSNCIWLCDYGMVNAYRHDVAVASDLAGGILGSWTWPHTVHFHDGGEPVVGGSVDVALVDILVGAWNPVAGSSWAYDMFVTRRALGDGGTMLDPRDGLHHAHRVESANVTVWDPLPVRATLPWVTLEEVEERIPVPDGAWADWDAANQVFITAAERKANNPGWEQTASVRSVVVYPDDIYDVPLHDGSTLSLGDFVMGMIMTFDRGKPESPVFDASEQSRVSAFLSSFKGVEIIHDGLGEEPLTIATYSDTWAMDAELNVMTWFPQYGNTWSPQYGSSGITGFWHMITVGWLAEASGQLAFSQWKANELAIPWMDYTYGPSLAVLEAHMDWAANMSFIPYEATLGDYIDADEIAERWANLQAWYGQRGHFWVGNGPFYLESVQRDYQEPVPAWQVNLSLMTAPHIGSVPGQGYTFGFGVREGASEGYSEGEGDLIAPPDPMMGVNAHFLYPENPLHEQNLVTSIVGPGETIVWPLVVKSVGDPGATNVTLSWDAGEIGSVPGQYSVLELREAGGNVLADMRWETSYIFSLQSDEVKHLYIVAAGHSEFVYQMKAGWNMVSLPLYTEQADPEMVFPGHVAIYTWDADSLSYTVPAEVIAGRGYWVLYFSDCEVAVYGVPAREYELLGAVAGWHMTGSVMGDAEVMVSEGSVYGTLYWWNPETLSYDGVGVIEAGRAYWLLGLTVFSMVVGP